MDLQQIRANTRAVERQRDEARLNKSIAPFFQSPDLVRVSAKISAIQGFGPTTKELMETFALAPEDALLWYRHLLDVWANYLYEFEYGGTDRTTLAIKRNLQYLDHQIFWKHFKVGQSPDFVQYVDSLRIDSPDDSPLPSL